ncbi:MAG: quinate 5-dehydrogenase [Clostridia bacterium]|nr:quinate 5-dehydrogenase [Clostridia bacterium]
MKRVVSVSLGSPKRDHMVEVELLGEKIKVERIGTNGDISAARALVRELDGKVDAFGLGGIDLYIFAGAKRYILRDAQKIAAAAKKTPVVDGSGLKNTLERRVIEHLEKEQILALKGQKVLLVSGVDRFGMAESLQKAGCEVTYGDLIFGLGIPIPLRSLQSLNRVAQVVAPVVSRLPFKYLYPTGKEQEQVSSKHEKYYHDANIIAGDFHYIRRHLPETLPGKIVLTNTVTKEDITLLQDRGVKVLITTTPELEGRSFGTNVLESILVALSGGKSQLDEDQYNQLLQKINFTPRVVQFPEARVS